MLNFFIYLKRSGTMDLNTTSTVIPDPDSDLNASFPTDLLFQREQICIKEI